MQRPVEKNLRDVFILYLIKFLVIMKHIYSLSFIGLFLISLASTSCKDDKGLGSFTANINGESWTAIVPTGVKTGNRLTITGLSASKQIVINIGGTTAGSYDMSLIEGSINPFVYTPDINQQGAQQTYTGTSGSIDIDHVEDKRINGTFNINAVNANMDVINVTGIFTDVKFF